MYSHWQQVEPEHVGSVGAVGQEPINLLNA